MLLCVRAPPETRLPGVGLHPGNGRFGAGPGNRTPPSGFGDPIAALEHWPTFLTVFRQLASSGGAVIPHWLQAIPAIGGDHLSALPFAPDALLTATFAALTLLLARHLLLPLRYANHQGIQILLRLHYKVSNTQSRCLPWYQSLALSCRQAYLRTHRSYIH